MFSGTNPSYSSYAHFYSEFWPIITIVTVNLLPAIAMIILLLAITFVAHTRRNLIVPLQSNTYGLHENHRPHYMYRQMFILMLGTLFFNFFRLPCQFALFRLVLSTFGIQQPYSLSVLLSAIFGIITASNYSLNFYLDCLKSKLFRRQFFLTVESFLLPFSNFTLQPQQSLRSMHT